MMAYCGLPLPPDDPVNLIHRLGYVSRTYDLNEGLAMRYRGGTLRSRGIICIHYASTMPQLSRNILRQYTGIYDLACQRLWPLYSHKFKFKTL
jgi:hypothetical protein